MELNRRQFLISVGAATVAAAVPKYVVPDEPAEPLAKARDLLASYDQGATFFKLKGDIVAREVGDRIEFEGYIFASKYAVDGRPLAVQHPESGFWVQVC